MSFSVSKLLWPRGGRSSLINTNCRGRSLSLIRCAVDFPEDFGKHHSNLRTSHDKTQQMVLRQAALVRERRRTTAESSWDCSWDLDEAYHRCFEAAAADICSVLLGKTSNHLLHWCISSIAKTVTSLLKQPLQDEMKASTAIYVWCRRTDELVDGINGCNATPEVLDRWKERLIDLYEGRPHDIFDAALSHTLSKYPIDLQLFKDLIQGMRMDMSKTRYENFDELYLYTYRIAGGPFMMFVQLTSAEHKASVYDAAIAYAVSGQLTDILRDVIEDARMGRIYLPQDELARAGLSEDDIQRGQFVSDEWRMYMKEQIKRAKEYADEGDKYLHEMKPLCRLPFSILSLAFRDILGTIEEYGYDLRKPTPVKLLKILPGVLVSCVKVILAF